jgi:hypothetical protein
MEMKGNFKNPSLTASSNEVSVDKCLGFSDMFSYIAVIILEI